MKCRTCCGIGFVGRGQERRFCPECDTGESVVPTMTKEEIKEAVKEALREHDAEKSAREWIGDPKYSDDSWLMEKPKKKKPPKNEVKYGVGEVKNNGDIDFYTRLYGTLHNALWNHGENARSVVVKMEVQGGVAKYTVMRIWENDKWVNPKAKPKKKGKK